MKEYIVQPGDTLPGVAKKTLGDASRWVEISQINKLVGPVQLVVGQRLLLPDSAYTCAPKPDFTFNSSVSKNSGSSEIPASVALARGFMFVVFEQLPEVGTGKIIRKVVAIPRDFSLRPANPFGSITPAEHALNLKPSQSQFLSGSNRSFGAPSIKGQPLLLDIAKIKQAGGQIYEVNQVVRDLEKFAVQNPSARAAVERLIWTVQKVEGEVLIKGGTPPGSGSAISAPHKAYVKSAEDFWRAFKDKQITKAQLEQELLNLEKAYSKAKIVGRVGRVLMVVGIVVTAVDLAEAGQKSIDQNSFKPIGAEVVRQVGGWTGAFAGAKIGFAGGAVIGIETGPGAIVTGAVGAIIFGAAGYFGADWVADQISEN
jgi:LysM repeat protein